MLYGGQALITVGILVNRYNAIIAAQVGPPKKEIMMVQLNREREKSIAIERMQKHQTSSSRSSEIDSATETKRSPPTNVDQQPSDD